jgi:hypothetical protein
MVLRILNLEPFEMSELEEEEKRKKFMEQQINYFEKTAERGEPPGIA